MYAVAGIRSRTDRYFGVYDSSSNALLESAAVAVDLCDIFRRRDVLRCGWIFIRPDLDHLSLRLRSTSDRERPKGQYEQRRQKCHFFVFLLGYWRQSADERLGNPLRR